jgi:hypothetical protein
MGKLPLEREIVDRRHDLRARPAGIGEVGGREPRLPVMQMDEARSPAVYTVETDIGSRPRERCETKRVVRPVTTIAAKVRVVRTIEEVRGVDDEKIEAGDRCRNDLCRAAEQVIVGAHRGGVCG